MADEDTSLIPADSTVTTDDDTTTTTDDSTTTTDTQPAPFKMYGEKGLNSDVVELLGDSDELKGARFFLNKYVGADDPNAEYLKGLNNLQYIASQKAYVRPPDDAPDNVKEEFNKQIRLLNQTPESAEGYNYKRPEDLAEEIPYSEEEATAYSEILHKHNASPGLAADLHELYVKSLSGVTDVVAQEEQAHRTAELTLLKDEHGVNAEKVIQDATHAGNLLGLDSEELSRIAMTAKGVNFLANLKSMISSDILGSGKSGDSITAGEGQSWSEKAMESSKLATEALKRNDNAAYEQHYADQVKFNKLAVHSRK